MWRFFFFFGGLLLVSSGAFLGPIYADELNLHIVLSCFLFYIKFYLYFYIVDQVIARDAK